MVRFSFSKKYNTISALQQYLYQSNECTKLRLHNFFGGAGLGDL
jgi:hypothetical protein